MPPKFKKRPVKRSSAPPQVADLVENGASEEESGDRWHGSDICKALRFYQRAYEYYRQACQLHQQQPLAANQPLVNDAQYNASRLLYHVFSEYQKTDGVEVHRLEGISEVLSSQDSVVKSIVAVIGAHEDTIDYLAPEVPTDLLFNTAMAYTDAIEEFDSEEGVLQAARRASELMAQVLKQQVGEIERYEGNGQKGNEGGGEEEENEGDEDGEDEDEEGEGEKSRVEDLFDTVVGALGLAQAVYENISPSNHPAAESLLSQLAADADTVAQELFSRFGPLQPPTPNSLSFQQATEYAVARAAAAAVSCTAMDQVFAVWADDQLPDAPERYMSAADCAETMLEKLGLNTAASPDPQLYWDTLSKMNGWFKQAQEGLAQKLRFSKPQDLDVGTLVSQIAKVHVARADIDLQRSQLPLEPARAHASVLAKNCRAFLTNALNTANQKGGIRERAVEKMQREKRRVEAMVRLCVLEGKSEDEMDRIVGDRWRDEAETLGELWYYPTRQPTAET